MRSLYSTTFIWTNQVTRDAFYSLFFTREAFYFLNNGGGDEIWDMYQILAVISSGDLTCNNGIGGVWFVRQRIKTS